MALKATLIGTSNTTVYTSAVTAPQIGNAITAMLICNYGATAANVTVYAVPNSGGVAGTAGTTNMIVNALNIPAGETVSLDQEKLVLDLNDTIVAFSSVATMLNFVISTIPV
jgi:hypothetical protein